MSYEELLEQIHERNAEGKVWSIENMAAHTGGVIRDTVFVAREIVRGRIYDYFRDKEGDYWYTSRKAG